MALHIFWHLPALLLQLNQSAAGGTELREDRSSDPMAPSSHQKIGQNVLLAYLGYFFRSLLL